MAKKISTALALAAFGLLLSISQVTIANAANLTADAGAVTNNVSSVKEVISITDIVKPHTVNDSKEVSLKPDRHFMEPVLWSPDGGRILIRSVVGWGQSEEVDEVYVMNADGTGLKKIVSSKFINPRGAWIASPTWIQGGDRIAFLLNRPNASLVVVVNPDGTGLKAIGTNLSDMESILTFLPDAGFWQGLYIGDLNEFTAVTEDGMNLENILKEDRKANAEKIASVERPKYSLYTMNPDGTGKTLLALTGWGEFFERPVYAWNPSGDKIVFSAIIDPVTGKQVDFDTFWARKEYYEAHIFLSDPDGAKRVQLTAKEPYNVITGGWSPDGSRLIVASSHDIEMRTRNVSIIKLSGFDEVMSIYAPSSIKQGFRTANKSITIQESPSGQSSPEPTRTAAPQISTPAGVTPKAPGFDVVLAIGIIYTINLFKRRYN